MKLKKIKKELGKHHSHEKPQYLHDMEISKKEIKDKICSEIQKTEKEIDELKEVTKPIAPENAIGRISRMDAINNQSISESALQNSIRKLLKLKIALDDIDKAGFGICVSCQKPIPLARILLVPQSNRCVNCA